MVKYFNYTINKDNFLIKLLPKLVNQKRIHIFKDLRNHEEKKSYIFGPFMGVGRARTAWLGYFFGESWVHFQVIPSKKP